jgi:hypothetical protein
MNSSSFDSLMGIFGLKSSTCKTCSHALPSAAYPQVYCPLKFRPVNVDYRCDMFVEKKK